MAACESLDFAGLQSEYDGASSPCFLARFGPGVLREFSNLVRLGEKTSRSKVSSADMDCVGLSGTTSLLSIPEPLVEAHAVAAEGAFQCRKIDSPQIGDCLYLKVLQFFFVTLPTRVDGRRAGAIKSNLFLPVV